MDIWNIVGFTASIMGASTLIPEVITAWKSRQLDDVAWGTLFLAAFSSLLWFAYSIRFNIIPLLFSQSMNLLMCSILIVMKYVYGKANKALKVSLKNTK